MAWSFRSRRVTPAVLLTSFVLVACGARGPLDITVIQEVEGTEAGSDTGTVEASTDASDGSTADATDAGHESGGFGIDGGPIINCGECLAESCGTQLLTCVESTDCRSAIQCVLTTCLSGGSLDPSCIEGCANGDLSALGDLVGAFTCVLENCASCTSVLGDLGGLGGGGGGSSSGDGG